MKKNKGRAVAAALCGLMGFGLAACTQAESVLPDTQVEDAQRAYAAEQAAASRWAEQNSFDLFAPLGVFTDEAGVLPGLEGLPEPGLARISQFEFDESGEWEYYRYLIKADGTRVPFEAPFESGRTVEFYGEELLAAVGSGQLARSFDDGAGWQMSPLTITDEAGGSLPGGQQLLEENILYALDYATLDEAYLLVRLRQAPEEMTGGVGTYALLASGNGGLSWQKRAAFEAPTLFLGMCFATPEVGWMVFRGEVTDPEPLVYETVDGGISWQRVVWQAPGEGADIRDVRAGVPVYGDEGWVLPLRVSLWGYMQSTDPLPYYYGSDGVWRWAAPALDLPEGADPVEFLAMLANVRLPENYTAGEGEVAAALIPKDIGADCSLTEFMHRTGRWSRAMVEAEPYVYTLPVTPEDKADQLRLEYGIENALDALYETHVPGEDVPLHVWHEHGTGINDRQLLEVGRTPEGDIRVMLEVYSGYSTDGPHESAYMYDMEAVFRYVEEEGTAFYTLLSTRVL